MKKTYVKIILSCLVMGLLTSASGKSNPLAIIHLYPFPVTEQDTTNLRSLLEVDTFNLKLLPPSLGIQFYKNEIVFLSRTKNEGKMLPDYISFGTVEAYYAIPGDSTTGKHMIFSQSSPFSYPCDGITFSPDFNIMYFTRLDEKDNKEKIYMAKYSLNNQNQQSWVSDFNPLSFCTENSAFTHPALSNDATELIFASDMKGSLGGMDLFITRKEGERWTAPQNLGNLINTAGNEFFPFLDMDNNLFYSTDGLPGYGGYDVFTCKFNGTNWDKPVNLSDLINSSDDDIAFTINKTDGKTAFFTRRRKSEKTDMQLFRVALNKSASSVNLATISYVFDGQPVQKQIYTAEKIAVEPKLSEAQSKISEPEQKEVLEVTPPVTLPTPAQKKEVLPVTSSETTKPVTAKPSAAVPVENIPEKKVSTEPVVRKDIIVYKVQMLSSATPRSNFSITVAGKTYETSEYYYLKGYRYTIGEFSSLASAVELQNICRKSGQKQAFVVAFKNGVRSLDPSLFK